MSILTKLLFIDPNTIRILITTDNHVGYAENDPIRGNDSAITFREIMNIAKDQEVRLFKHHNFLHILIASLFVF